MQIGRSIVLRLGLRDRVENFDCFDDEIGCSNDEIGQAWDQKCFEGHILRLAERQIECAGGVQVILQHNKLFQKGQS